MFYLDWHTLLFDDGDEYKTNIKWSFWDTAIDGLVSAMKEPKRRCVVNYRNGVLMQFTGLHDRNGKEIYEGDIIQGATFYPMEVVSTKFGWGVKWTDIQGDSRNVVTGTIDEATWQELIDEEMEVIGNIYTNPELLEAHDDTGTDTTKETKETK